MGKVRNMRNAKETLDATFLEMRWRALSLAADLDRIERSDGGPRVLSSDPRLSQLRQAFQLLLDGKANRAEQLQLLFSDQTPPPNK
jgi:hypothetical protein